MHLPILVALPLIITILLIIIVQELFFFGCRSSPATLPPTNNEPDNRVSGPCPYNHSQQFAFEGSGGFIQCESVSQSISPCIQTPVVGLGCWSVVSSPAGGSQSVQTDMQNRQRLHIFIPNYYQPTNHSTQQINHIECGGGWYVM